MGDMKTPDFDDLLAAFDIPDMVDPKAAIESSHHDDHESQLKQTNGGVTTNEDEAHNPSAGHDIGVSVIVKNIRNMDAGENGGNISEKDGHFHSHPHTHAVTMGNGLHNGFLPTIPPSNHYTKNGWKAPREEGLPVSNPSSTFNQFSPISSAEEFDDDDKIEVDDPMDKQGSQSFYRPTPNSIAGHPSCSKREEQKSPKSPISVDSVSKPRANVDSGQSKPDQNNNNGTLGCSKFNNPPQSRKPVEEAKETVLKPQEQESKEAGESSRLGSVTVSNLSQAKAKSSAKLSSCIAAIAALSAKKATVADLGVSDSPTVQRESIHITPQRESPKEANESPRAPEKPHEQESAMEVAKRLLSREPDSPSSVTSEGSSKGSPASPTGTTPVIPKVRIKTIKTSSGQIKRTVTRVLPEFNPEGLKKGENLNIPSVMASSMLSSTISNAIFSSPTRSSLPTTVVATTGGHSMEVTKQMTIKPVATAFLPVSAVKTAGSQVINLKLANNTTVKATVIPAASVQSASNAILKAANAIQQQTVMVPASSLANAKLVPKTVHLSNLNLLPQTVSSAACELHQVLPSSKKPQHQQPQQQVKQQTILVGHAPKKVSRVQVFTSSQSSVVDAFNKVLSSINPVPVYVPNLSPPTSACISLPSRGYKCLECGDSFAIEKSLTQHYERRSVRIEVTCNHCAKSLVFYNKCSLLSHARGHKDKGVVMQCSHLILKPIPADQMLTTSPSSGQPNFTSNTQAQGSAGQIPGKVGCGGTHNAVISAPCSAPLVAAMPLEDDASKLCRHSLKCLECNEMFQDESSLAMHYQQALESSGQKTCTICQMLLPNQCSFVSHQRIHQHKSPYICPECGASCRSVHFQSHVTKNCLHYTRRVGYRLIYKCSMCDTVFTLQSLLYTHFDQHIVNHKVSVFKCPDCSMHYAQKQLMLDHIKAIHGTLKTIEGPPNLGINLPLSTKPTNSNSNNDNSPSSNNNNRDGGNINGQDRGDKKPPPLPLKKSNSNCSVDLRNPPGPGYTCGDCDCLFTSREVFVAHMRREHGKILKKHPCRQCDKSFSSSHSLCRHNRLKHKGLRRVYPCPHCPALCQPFTKRVLLDQHIQLIHGVKDPEGKTVDPDNMEAIPVKEHSQTLSPKRKQEEDEGSPGLHPRGSDSQPLKKLKVNILKVHKCAVCGFTTEDITAFHEHIPQHKSDGSSYQCQECGLCYTSHHSLARHLFIVHRLKEPQGLARCNGRGNCGDESQRENQLDITDENNDGTPNTKCKVCGKMFETEGNLNTHMRTHGMAFIKSKRLSTAEK
ncbi:zinc finger protein 532 isoform X2 [Centroberyx affinis]|uniref:zinc finger protein 532 isoform X2 n=1 Tax=Centroberyx affinis TaxID=166261 RepID=UPI003A5BA7B1